MSHIHDQPTAIQNRWKKYTSLFDNPLLTRDVLTTLRLSSIRAVLVLLPLAITAIVLVVAEGNDRSLGNAAAQGATILGIALSTALYVVGIVGAVLGAQSIAGERQAKTLDLVLVTEMSPWRIILGKAAAVWIVLALLVLACIPPLGICFVVGGVSLGHMFLAIIVPLAVAIVPVALGLALGAAQQSSKIAVGAAAAAVGLVGPMVFSMLWMAILFVIGTDRFIASEPFFLPSGNEGFWSLLIGGVFMPLFFIIVPSWFLLALAVSALSNEAGDRARPLRRWFMVAGPLGGILLAAIALVESIDNLWPGILCVSLLGVLLCFGALALAAHPCPRITGSEVRKVSFLGAGPNGNALFVLFVGVISLMPIVVTLVPVLGATIARAAVVVLAFLVLINGSGVLLASVTTPRLARWVLAGIGILCTFLPLLLLTVIETFEPSTHHADNVGLVGLFSPIGTMIQLETSTRYCSSCMDIMPCISVAIWTVLGAIAWWSGAKRLQSSYSK